jgi:hypothetical protein
MGIAVAVTRVAANTSTGDQDITTTDLGGLTPKAVWLTATRATSDGAAADGAGYYQGVSDGTLHVNHGAESEHNLDTTDTQTAFDAVSPPVLVIYDGTADSAIDGSADFSAFITNGVTINWSDAPSAGWLITAVFFAGTDLSAAVFREGVGNTVDLATDITSIGFEADDVILPFLQGAPPRVCCGLIHNDRAGGITQRSLLTLDRNGRGTSELYASLRTDACIEEIGVTGAADWYGEASAFDSSGFTLTTRAAGGNSRSLCGIALRYGSSPAVGSAVYTFSTPTGTGSATDTGLGAEPQAVIYLTSLLEAAGSIASDSLAGSYGVAVITAGAQYHNTISSEDNAGTSNTQSLSDNQAVNLPLHDGSAGMAATYSAFTGTGVTLSWSDVESAAKLWPALAIGSGAAGGTTYEQSASGAMSPAGALAKQTSHLLAGALSPAGALNNQAQKFLSGAVSFAGGLVNQAQKVLAGTLTSTSALSRLTARVLAGEISPAGAVTAVRTILVSLAGALSPAGSLARQTGKVLGGEVSPAGTVSRLTAHGLTAGLSFSGALSKQTARALAGALSFAGALAGEVVSTAIHYVSVILHMPQGAADLEMPQGAETVHLPPGEADAEG